MHVVVIFHNIGGYHAARLRAAHAACQRSGWRMTAIQVTDSTQEHPWGDLEREITFPLKSLLPAATSSADKDQQQNPAAAPRLLRESLDGLQPDAVVIPGWGFAESRAALAWCRRNSALAILMSESKWDDEKRVWWKESIKSLLYVRKFDAAIVGGGLHRDYLIKLGLPGERIFLGYDVVDNNYFAGQAEAARQDPLAARRRQPSIPVKPFFLAATRLIERKNVARLIEAFAIYRQQVGFEEAWDLVVCGSGEQEQNIRRIISERNLNESVHLPGFVPYQAIGDWYGLAAAFVHPALQEQWGLVINEACAAGLPILASRTVGACHEIVRDKYNGLLFDPHSTGGVTQALLKMHSIERDARTHMGRCSREIIANFNSERFADGIMQAITTAAAATKNGYAKTLAEA